MGMLDWAVRSRYWQRAIKRKYVSIFKPLLGFSTISSFLLVKSTWGFQIFDSYFHIPPAGAEIQRLLDFSAKFTESCERRLAFVKISHALRSCLPRRSHVNRDVS